MRTIRRKRAASGSTCERCRRTLPSDAFGRSEKLAGGRHPWCAECAGSGPPEERRAAYQRSYMRRRRADAATRWLTVAVPGRGRMLARWSATRREVRITGPFALAEDARGVLTGAFGVGASDVRESGAGGGRGARRQKTFSSRAPVEQAAWERGRDLLVADGVARIGKGPSG